MIGDEGLGVDCLDRRPLGSQLADVLRAKIRSGAIRRGGKIPGVRELAAAYGVGVRVAREAVQSLSMEGLVVSRPRIGCVVLNRPKRAILGEVLFIFGDGNVSYYANVVLGCVEKMLQKAGYLVRHYVANRQANGELDVSNLTLALQRRTDLAFALTDKSVVTILAENRVPYVVVPWKPFRCRGCAGLIQRSRSEAVGQMVRRCVQKGVRHVLSVCLDGREVSEKEAFESVGIRTEVLEVVRGETRSCIESIQRGAYEKIKRRLAEGPLPDLVYFSDDVIAIGGILAISDLGLSAPEDVRIVSMVNEGVGVLYKRPLTRISIDPTAHGVAIARALLAYLRTGRFPRGVCLKAKWKGGDTF